MARPSNNLNEKMTTITLRMPADGKAAIRRAAKKHRMTQDQLIGNAFNYARQRGAFKLFKQEPPARDPLMNKPYQVRILIEIAIAIQLAAQDVNMYQGQFVFECWTFAVDNGFLDTLLPGEKRKYIR